MQTRPGEEHPSAQETQLTLFAHLSDVPHLILKVTDRPLTGRPLPLSLRDTLLDSAGHFGLRVLQRCLCDPIGGVSVGLRGARIHSSASSRRPG